MYDDPNVRRQHIRGLCAIVKAGLDDDDVGEGEEPRELTPAETEEFIKRFKLVGTEPPDTPGRWN
jgi:hypothetical protein